MITFLPFPDVLESLRCLDLKRLVCQRVEARQILRLIRGELKHFTVFRQHTEPSHPAVLMWVGYEAALVRYYNAAVAECERRGCGHRNFWSEMEKEETVKWPEWFGVDEFHRSHQQKLLAKDADYYGQFGWKGLDEPGATESSLRYEWPAGGWAEYRNLRKQHWHLRGTSSPKEAEHSSRKRRALSQDVDS
mmetsp:Transcript_66599/g.124289  ORF Transcript_66599/g.124289 Transcript_66599/m.124289 type:complete len:191 (+) Transcript_66599:76-648(+)